MYLRSLRGSSSSLSHVFTIIRTLREHVSIIDEGSLFRKLFGESLGASLHLLLLGSSAIFD